MKNTNIMAEFRIIGDEFDPNTITNKLSLKPNCYWVKGDKIENRDKYRSYSCWAISTGYEESLDVNIQLARIIEILKAKMSDLIELKSLYNLDYRLDVVINIENNEKPAIYLNSDVIEFAYKISAEFDFDLYIFS